MVSKCRPLFGAVLITPNGGPAGGQTLEEASGARDRPIVREPWPSIPRDIRKADVPIEISPRFSTPRNSIFRERRLVRRNFSSRGGERLRRGGGALTGEVKEIQGEEGGSKGSRQLPPLPRIKNGP
ncbi:hypothetical protein KM043_012487 [Ampulex compressa]|nr:hypothetical protein KM043_012487 [Ampulex compressa]